jgi:hypothetical protein
MSPTLRWHRPRSSVRPPDVGLQSFARSGYSHYRWNRRTPTSFTAWIRAVTAAIPDGCCSKTTHLQLSAHWGRPQCSRVPDNWRFECPPTLETERAPLWESHHTPTTGRILAEKVTPSPSQSVGLPVANTTLGSEHDRGEESRGGHSTPRKLPSDRSLTDSNGVLAWESATLTLPT